MDPMLLLWGESHHYGAEVALLPVHWPGRSGPPRLSEKGWLAGYDGFRMF